MIYICALIFNKFADFLGFKNIYFLNEKHKPLFWFIFSKPM